MHRIVIWISSVTCLVTLTLTLVNLGYPAASAGTSPSAGLSAPSARAGLSAAGPVPTVRERGAVLPRPVVAPWDATPANSPPLPPGYTPAHAVEGSRPDPAGGMPMRPMVDRP